MEARSHKLRIANSFASYEVSKRTASWTWRSSEKKLCPYSYNYYDFVSIKQPKKVLKETHRWPSEATASLEKCRAQFGKNNFNFRSRMMPRYCDLWDWQNWHKLTPIFYFNFTRVPTSGSMKRKVRVLLASFFSFKLPSVDYASG